MSKQDRQGVRSATDLERKYKFGQDLTEITKIANNANRAATNAQSIANSAASEAASAKATADSHEERIVALESGGGASGGETADTSEVTLEDRATGKKYTLFVNNGKLMMEESEE